MQLVTSWLERFITHNAAVEKKWVRSLAAEGKVLFLPDSVEIVGEGTVSDSPKSKENKQPKMWGLIKEPFPSQFSM